MFVRSIVRFFGAALVVLIFSTLLGSGYSQAKQPSILEWDEPIPLSDPQVNSNAPAITTDSTGGVHVIWSQMMATENRPPAEGDTLFYARWNGETWTKPMDIMISPVDGIEWPDIAATPDGRLHVVWATGGKNSRLYYASAPACCAEDARSWSKPVLLDMRILDAPAVLADPLGRLHVAYASQETNDIIYTRSIDGGSTWSSPIQMPSGVVQEDEYSIYPRLAADDSGRVHLVWTNLPWPGRSIMYARSHDGGLTWESPHMIDSFNQNYRSESYGPIYVDVEAWGENQVHIIWDGPPTVERNHIWSADGGRTWSSRSLLFPEITLAGRSGWNDMAFDSAGILHSVTLGALHATFDGSSWSSTEVIAPSDPSAIGCELLRIAIGLGNQLNVVWVDKDTTPFIVYYSHAQANAPELPSRPFTSPTSKITPSTPEDGSSISITAVITPSISPILSEALPPVQSSSPTGGVVIGIVPVVSLLIVIIAFRFIKKTK